MTKTITSFRICFCVAVLLLSHLSVRAQHSAKMPTLQEMAEGINKGRRYNVKKVVQANDATKFTSKYDNPQLRQKFDFDRLKDPATGAIPEGIREKELEYILSPVSHLQDEVLSQRRRGGAGNIKTAIGDPVTMFTNRGPFNVGGRTRALAIDINNENRILAGAASGGIWLSTNQGVTWQRVSPLDQNPSMTSIVQDKRAGFQNIWYCSTGETTGASQGSRNGSSRFMGNGIYKSTDNGDSWALLPATVYNTPQNNSSAEPFELTAAMDIDPVSGDLYVATYRGLYRTQDGGSTFELVLGIENLGFFGQLDVHISNDRIFYAVIPRNVISVAGPGNAGIYRSATGNSGEWIRITPPEFPATHGRTVVRTAPSNGDILYVLSDGTNSAPVGHDFWKYTYLSGDGSGAGGTWEDRSANLPGFGGSVGDFNTQGGYDQHVRVHPADENMVFIGGTNLYRSTDGFATAGNTTWIAGYNTTNDVSLYPNHHPDQHSMVFFPSNPNKVITGHDGGLSLTQNITTNFPDNPVTWTSLNNGYLTTQVYALSAGPGNLVMAGFQDNSTWSTTSSTSTTTWIDQFGGDGCATAVNKTGTLRYVSAQQGVVYRIAYTDANDNTPNAYTHISPIVTGLFVTQYELDPNDDKLMYYIGTNTIWRANDVTEATTSAGWNNLNNTTSTQQLSAIGISTIPANIVYTGNTTGQIFRIDNANTGNPAYIDISAGKGLPAGNVSCLAVDPANAMRVIVIFSNYNIRSMWLTENGGTTWTDIGGNLEQNSDGTGNGPSVRWLTFVGNNSVYLAGTSTGLYSTKTLNGTSTVWSQVDPSVLGVSIVEQIRAREDGLVVVGTHGNGLFSAQYEISMLPVVVNESVANVSVLQDAAPVVIPIGNVFRSTAGVPLPITVSVDNNTNTGLVDASISGGDLTLTFTAGSSGTALITLKGADTNAQFASFTFSAEVNPVITTFPFVTDFPTGTLPFGYKVSGNLDWLVNSGGTPTAATGPAGDNTQPDGSGFYLFTETSGARASATGDFLLPVTDISSLTSPGLSFFYHMHGATTGSLEVYIKNTGTGTSTRVLQLVGEQQLNEADPYQEIFISLASYVPVGKIQIFFRGVRGSTETSSTGDIAIDDIVVSEGLSDDIGIQSVTVKNLIAQDAQEEVSIEIANVGTLPQSDFDVSYLAEGGSTVTETYSGTLGVGETTSFTFATKFSRSIRGAFQITASTLLTTDGNAANNTGTATSMILPAANLPYEESFETTDGGWTAGGTGSSWELGVPAKNFINAASSGIRAWVTNLAGDYPINEQSFVLSPVFSVSGLNEIDIHLDLKYMIEEGWDGAALQASTDVGTTWTNVGVLGDPENWYNYNLLNATGSPVLNFDGGNGDAWSGTSSGYLTASNTILGLAGKSTLLLRVVFASDEFVNEEGIAFDNVVIGSKQNIMFGPLPAKVFGNPSFALSAAGGASGEPVVFASSDPSVATISGNTVTITGAGTTTITASQAGNAAYFPAQAVTQNLLVNKAPQTITFNEVATVTLGDPALTLEATSTSGLNIIFESMDDKITVSGNSATLVGAGKATVVAKQGGNENYTEATPVEQNFCVNPAKPTITVSDLIELTPKLASSASTGNQWYKDGVAISDAVNATYEITEGGSYTVEVTIDDCSSEPSDAHVLIITGEPGSVGNTAMSLYPNPVKTELMVSLAAFDRGRMDISIIDLSGKQVMKKNVRGGGEIRMNVHGLPASSYFVRAVQKIKTGQLKFVKE